MYRLQSYPEPQGPCNYNSCSDRCPFVLMQCSLCEAAFEDCPEASVDSEWILAVHICNMDMNINTSGPGLVPYLHLSPIPSVAFNLSRPKGLGSTLQGCLFHQVSTSPLHTWQERTFYWSPLPPISAKCVGWGSQAILAWCPWHFERTSTQIPSGLGVL